MSDPVGRLLALLEAQMPRAEVEADLGAYDFAHLVDRLYHLTFDDFCDWYAEAIKPRLYAGDEDAKATALYAGSYGRAPDFFSFYRSLDAYKKSFSKKDDIMIVDPSSDFFKYMKKPGR